MGSEEFLNQMVETLGIIIDRHPKGKPHKMESQTIKKIGCDVPILNGFAITTYYLLSDDLDK